jgi:hypothetical protein
MQKIGKKRLSRAVSTKLTVDDYDICRRIARDFYIKEKIKSPSVSELIRFVLSKLLDAYRSPMGPRDANHPKSFRFVRPG